MIRTVGALIGLSLLLPAAATAQATPAAPMVSSPPGGMTLQQFQAKRRARLMAVDADHDGRISMAEYASRPGHDGRQADPGKTFARFDLNHDGYLDAREIDAMDARKFQKKDANGDGIVSRGEHGARARGPAGAVPAGAAAAAPRPQ